MESKHSKSHFTKVPVQKIPNFAYSKRYSELDKLGEGAFGYVVKAEDTTNGNLVALKKISLRTSYSEDRSLVWEEDQEGVQYKRNEELIPRQIFREIKSLQELEGHENILR